METGQSHEGIGVAEIGNKPVDESVEQIIHRADKALDGAKTEGRNLTLISSPKPQEKRL